MNPYRTNAATLRVDTLEQLFGAKANLGTEDGLGLSYRLLPWKRHVSTVRFTPDELEDCLAELAKMGPLRVDVLRADHLGAGRYDVAQREGDFRLVRQGLPSDDAREETFALGELERVRAAHVRAGDVRLALGDGELRFEVSSYEVDELAPRFRQAFPWEKLGLPALTGRDWLILDRPA